MTAKKPAKKCATPVHVQSFYFTQFRVSVDVLLVVLSLLVE